MQQGGRPRGGVWDVRPPEHALGRRKHRRQSSMPEPANRGGRAPSPLLPRIGSRGDVDAHGGNNRSVLTTMESRLAMLEERLSNVDRENAFLRHQMEQLNAGLAARVEAESRVRFGCCCHVSCPVADVSPLTASPQTAGDGWYAEAVQDARRNECPGQVHRQRER